MLYAIAYDIVDDARRNRAAKFLEGWGRRVQKSLFECDLDADDLQKVTACLRDILVLSEDRCHIYRLCADCFSKSILIGNALEPQWPGAIVA